MFGYGVARYIVLPTTIGSPSWPRSTPVEKVHATFRFLTLSAVICPRSLYRVDDGFLLGIDHSLSLPVNAGAAAVDDAGAEPELHAATTTEQPRPTRATSRDTLNICAPRTGRIDKGGLKTALYFFLETFLFTQFIMMSAISRFF